MTKEIPMLETDVIDLSPVVRGSVHVLRIPRTAEIRNSYANFSSMDVVAVQLHTADGLTGLGWTNVIGTGAPSIASFIDTDLLSIAIGSDPTGVRGTWERMYRHSMSRGRKGIAMYAISAVDIALWDLLAQRAELPLHHLLGCSRESVPVYGDGCWLSMSIDDIQAEARRYVDAGMWGVKVKIGGALDSDVQRLSAVREVLGAGQKLLVDANQQYDVLDAVRVARCLEELDVFWFEEPILADLSTDYATIAARTRVALAAGENEYGRYGFRNLIQSGGIAILQPDVHRVGGVSEFMRIAAMAEAFGLAVAPHTSYELHSQLLGATTTGLVCEYYDWFPQGFFLHDFEVRDGMVEIPATAGIGARFEPSVFRSFAYEG